VRSVDPIELIRLERVTCAYGASPVLVNVDLALTSEQFSGIVGPSGSGKTTLLRVLLGTVRPIAGTVERRSGLRVGYVPQVDAVNWSFPVTVAECVLMARTRGRVLPWRSEEERTQVDAILTRLGIVDLAGRHIRELSGGSSSGCSSLAPCWGNRSCSSWMSPPPGSTCGPATRCSTSSMTSTVTGWPSC